MKISWLYITLFFFGGLFTSNQPLCETSYAIEVLHPGIDLNEKVSKTLIKSTCNASQEPEYYMDVESVVCGDSQCKIDVIRLYWDELGFFKNLELPQGVALEKAEGASFTERDYSKLNSILSDRNSSLKYVDKYEVTSSETSEGIDALSGATIALDVNSYVKGAVWTCYTLWHWVHGDVETHIRNTTANNLSSQEIIHHLKNEDKKYRQFALEQLIRKKIKASDVVLALTDTKDKATQKLIIAYLEQLPSDAYFGAMKKLMQSKNEELTLLSLASLKQQKNIPTSYLEALGENIYTWNSYPKINSYLTIIEQQESVSKENIHQVSELLTHPDFIIARRAYWLLRNQKLSKNIEKALSHFYKKHNERL